MNLKRCALTLLVLAGQAVSAADFALRFDGTNDLVTFGTAAGLGATQFTLEVWFQRNSTGTLTTTGTGGLNDSIPLLTKGRGEAEASNQDMNYHLCIRQGTRFVAGDFEQGAGGTAPGSNAPVTGVTAVNDTGVWHHAAITYDLTNFSVYLDGVLDNQLPTNQPPRGDSIQHAALGSALTSVGAPAGFFSGLLDEPRIWNYARSAAEINADRRVEYTNAQAGLLGRWGLNEGTGTTVLNSAGTVITGILSNGPAWSGGYPFTYAGVGGIYFDGANDYVTFGPTNALGVSNFTLEAWFKRTGSGIVANTGGFGVTGLPLIAKGRNEVDQTNSLDMNFFFGLASNGVLVADFEEDASGANPGLNHPVRGNTATLSNTWYHAAATYDGTDWRLYLNGALETNLAVGQPPRFDSVQHASLAAALNSAGTPNGAFAGVLDEVRIWNYARSQSEITNNMLLQIASAAGLIGRWAFDEERGFVATNDADGAVYGTLTNGPVWVAGYPFVSNFPPSVSLTNPLGGEVFYQPTDVTIQATATDTDGTVSNVDLFANGVLVGTSTTAPYGVVWTNVGVGTHRLMAVARDDEGNAATSAAVSITVAPTSGVGALFFDGINDYVTFGPTSTLGADRFTLEVLFMRTGTGTLNTTGTGGVTNMIPLLTKGRGEADATNNVDMNYFLGIRASDGVLFADLEEGAAGSNPGSNHVVLGSTPVVSNVWHHAAATYDGTNWAIYLNGVLDGAANVGFLPRSDSIQHAGLASALNSAGTPAGFFNGLLDEARVWNYARSSSEVFNARYSAIASAPGLLGRWSLDEGTGLVASNSAVSGGDGALSNGPIWVAGYPLSSNVAPVAVDDSVTTNEEAVAVVDVAANDTDTNGNLDTNSVLVLTVPANGAVTTNAGGVLTFTPALNFHGTNTFDYQICDTGGACDTGTVTVTVTPVNDPPVASNSAIAVPADTASPLTLTADDPDGDVLTYVLLSSPSNGAAAGLVATNGTLTYTPVHAYSGSDTIGFTVHDGALTSAAATVSLTVTALPDGDSDGMPDAFETQYGVSDPAGHDDGDGVPNLDEYYADTIPTNGASFLHLVGSVVTNAAGHLLITWDSVGGVRYRVAYGDGTAGGGYDGLYTDLVRSLQLEMEDAPLNTPSTQDFTDDFQLIGGPPATGARYFQIKAVR